MEVLSERLGRIGKELLGSGDAALVWSWPDAAWAIKLGFDGDDGWPAWADWCQSNPGPHVPVVQRVVRFDHAGRTEGFFGVIERLRPTDVARTWLAADRTLKRRPLCLAAQIEGNHPTVAQLLRDAADAFPGARWDLAPANWMARSDGELVLTDPLSRA